MDCILCDFLHGIRGFTRAATRDYLTVVKGTGAYTRTIGEIAERIETKPRYLRPAIGVQHDGFIARHGWNPTPPFAFVSMRF